MRNSGIEVDEVNYAKQSLTEAAVRRIVKAAGAVARVVNVRHALAKERGWAEHPPSLADFTAAVLADPNVLRRPVLIRGDTVLIGYDKSNRDAWAALTS